MHYPWGLCDGICLLTQQELEFWTTCDCSRPEKVAVERRPQTLSNALAPRATLASSVSPVLQGIEGNRSEEARLLAAFHATATNIQTHASQRQVEILCSLGKVLCFECSLVFHHYCVSI